MLTSTVSDSEEQRAVVLVPMAQPSSDSEPRNLILAALPSGEMQLFREQGQKVSVHEGKTLQGAGQEAQWLFFPTSAVLSLLGVTQDGLSVETGLVGREGMVGFSQYYGHSGQLLECQVKHKGDVCQIPAALVRQEQLPGLERLLLGYANYRMAELAQGAVCNRFHLLRQRFCRWLLTAQDRTGKHEMDFTQEMLAAMVGARRPVVASLIGRLQDERLIDYRRGCIVILDRAGLERSACECYAILCDELAGYLGSFREAGG